MVPQTKDELPDPPIVTVVLLGDDNVGKSTFLTRLSQPPGHATRPPRLHPSQEPITFNATFSGDPYTFEFFTSSPCSPTHYTQLSPSMVILCYSISNRLSLINLKRFWAKEISRHFSEDFRELPILVVGLKRDERKEGDENGIIYPEEGKGIASELRAAKYMECSAVTGELVKEVFEDICRTGVRATKGNGVSEGGCILM